MDTVMDYFNKGYTIDCPILDDDLKVSFGGITRGRVEEMSPKVLLDSDPKFRDLVTIFLPPVLKMSDFDYNRMIMSWGGQVEAAQDNILYHSLRFSKTGNIMHAYEIVKEQKELRKELNLENIFNLRYTDFVKQLKKRPMTSSSVPLYSGGIPHKDLPKIIEDACCYSCDESQHFSCVILQAFMTKELLF